MIELIEQDLLTLKCDAIMHQCNCFCTMGSGVARSIRGIYPEVYEADLRTKRGDRDKLGKVGVAKIKNSEAATRFCFNAYSQYEYGYGKRQTNYESYYVCLSKIRDYAEKNGFVTVAAPYKMGCALAGGDWDICYAMFKSVFENSKVSLAICKHPKREVRDNIKQN
jgi:O-acetyl-ADP-ribose deacetylase (regulator of RNase III)